MVKIVTIGATIPIKLSTISINPGLNIIIPVIDSPRQVPVRATIRDGAGNKYHQVSMETSLDLREQVYDFPAQQVITKDNVGILVDAVVYFAIMEPQRATYEIANLPLALETLTQTTLRNVIGEMDLDDTLSSRDTLNAKLVETIDQAANQIGFGRPDKVVGVNALFAGNVTQSTAIGVIRHAGDVA